MLFISFLISYYCLLKSNHNSFSIRNDPAMSITTFAHGVALKYPPSTLAGRLSPVIHGMLKHRK